MTKSSGEEQGRRLEDYPRPSVAVDTAVLTVPEGRDRRLSVLLVRREGRHQRGAWCLPGTFVHRGETLAQAALRALQVKAGVEGLHPLQLHVFDDPTRDDRGWVLSVAHLDVVPAHRLQPALEHGAELRPVDDAGGLAFDHDQILDLAVAALRAEYAEYADPRRLLPEPFTLRQLQHLHEAVAGMQLPKDAFRRAMQTQLQDAGRLSEGQVGKPARLWRRRRET